jgi:small subunit ribosomal protein S5
MRGRPGPRSFAPRPQSEFEERIVQIDRVARVQKGGRRFRFRATVVIGDRKERVGLGVAKASDVQGAIRKAVSEAKKELMTVKIHRHSIPFTISTSFSGAKVLLKPAQPGTGIIAGGAVRPVIELAGITNVLSKSLGSDNRINIAKAAMLGLKRIAATDISKLTEGSAKAEPGHEKTKPTKAKPAAKDTAKTGAAK